MNSMKNLKQNGFGGCIVFNKPPTGFSREEYLSDQWFDMIKNFAEAGCQMGMQIWINDGFDFPPGDVAGRIERLDPSLRQSRLELDSNGKVAVVETEWGFPAFEEPESSRLFIKLVYEEYYKRLGKYFGNGITGFFSDTDCRRINAHILDQLNGEPYFPWSRNFAAEFEKKYSYRIDPYLADIVRDRGEPSVSRDYWCLAGELYTRWFRNNYEWCRKHGVLYSFHSSDTGPFTLKDCPRSSIFAEGAFLHQAQFCDYPGTDHELLALDGGTHFDSRYYVASSSWGGDCAKARTPDFNLTQWDLRAKYTASAAYLYGKERVLCEAFAATNWGASHQDLRRIATWQIMQGVNFFVPHAVHHRFHGETRYFAPPEFLSGSLKYGLKEFNEALTEMCYIASQGELIDPVAVLDPTETVWNGDDHCLFELCDRLNRMPVNYVIVNEESLDKNPECFKTLLLPGIELNQEMRRILTEKGYLILTSDELDKLDLPDVSFDGGDVHYMRRRLNDGSEMLLVANVWSDEPRIGTLRFNQRELNIKLYPGEIAVVNGPFERFHSTESGIPLLQLPESMPVHWDSDNVIPLPGLEQFEFHTESEIPHPYLLVPSGTTAVFDDSVLSSEKREEVEYLGERFLKIPLPGGGTPGNHYLNIISSLNNQFCVSYILGDFDVEVKTENDFFRKYRNFYNMALYLPEKMEVKLRPRSTCLQRKCWTEQGAPFYSGTATSCFRFEYVGGRVRLSPGKANGTCLVKLNGQHAGIRIWEPFEFELDLKKGVNILEITVSNTLANVFECYKAPGGLIHNKDHEINLYTLSGKEYSF